MPFTTSTAGTAAADAALDALVASFPTDATFRLYTARPTTGGTELPDDGGYEPVPASYAPWAAADGGQVTTSTPVSYGASTGAYGDVATYWGIADASGAVLYYDELADPIDVSDAGTTVAFTPAVFFRGQG
jgi:hypothetical protein